MKTELKVREFNLEELKKYLKEEAKWFNSMIDDIVDNLMINCGVEIDDEQKIYSYITHTNRILIDIEGKISKDIDNDKYDYYVLCGESERDLMDELNMCLKEFPNKIIKLIENRFTESYTSAIYDKEAETMNLVNNRIDDEVYKSTIFRFNKETKRV